jgi:hypothetical protein
LVGSPLLNVSKREIEVSPQTPDLSVSPSDQKTPPVDDSSDSKSCATSKEDKDDSYGEDYGYTEDTYDHTQYDANHDFNEEANGEGYTDERYQDHKDYEYDQNENINDFQITNQEYYSDMYPEVTEEKQCDDDVYTTTSHTSLKALTPVKLRASVTVVTEEIPPQVETKSLVDSPQSTSSSLTNFSTDIEIEQLFSKVRHNRIGDVKAILERGVNARMKDSNGNSLLHICAQNNLKKMASIVLEFGADINAENKKGITALDYCDNYHFDKLGDWFVQNGGDNSHANLRT